MPVTPVSQWGKSVAQPEDQISNCVVNPNELRHTVDDTVLQLKGFPSLYRPGDWVKQVHGVRFHR